MEHHHNNTTEEISGRTLPSAQGDDEINNPIIFENSPDENFFDSFIECDYEDSVEYAGERVVWLDCAIKLLLSSVEELRGKVGKIPKLKNKNRMWLEIEKIMHEKGYRFSVKQIQNKFHSLERAYKKAKNHNASTGRNRQPCPYERELDEIFGKRPIINPICVLGAKETSCGSAAETRIHNREEGSPEPGPSNVQTSTPCASETPMSDVRRKRRYQSKSVTVLQDMQKEQAEHNRNVMGLLEKSIEKKTSLMQERNRILKERNVMLKELLETVKNTLN